MGVKISFSSLLLPLSDPIGLICLRRNNFPMIHPKYRIAKDLYIFFRMTGQNNQFSFFLQG